MAVEKWVVGPEYDDALLARLKKVLQQLGYKSQDKWHGVGGSQDIWHWEVVSEGEVLIIESETYMGLSVAGSADRISILQDRFSQA